MAGSERAQAAYVDHPTRVAHVIEKPVFDIGFPRPRKIRKEWRMLPLLEMERKPSHKHVRSVRGVEFIV